MGKIALLFSGQGAQYPGMGQSLCEASPAAKAVFDLADRIRPGTAEQCFAATKEELSLTKNTQPCVYCVDLAAAEALKEQGIVPDAVAGFSLGEVAALTFSGVLTPEDGFRLVCKRAAFMEEATQQTGGGMAAVLKLSDEQVEEFCRAHQNVYPVNYNCPGQVSVAGEKTELDALCKDVQAAGGRAVPLAVSGAFHSPFMDTAADRMAEELQQVSVHAPGLLLYANYTASPYPAEKTGIKMNIARQVNHPVPWQAILRKLDAEGFTAFIEVGPGKTLSGLVKKTLPKATICRVEDAETLRAAVEELKR